MRLLWRHFLYYLFKGLLLYLFFFFHSHLFFLFNSFDSVSISIEVSKDLSSVSVHIRRHFRDIFPWSSSPFGPHSVATSVSRVGPQSFPRCSEFGYQQHGKPFPIHVRDLIQFIEFQIPYVFRSDLEVSEEFRQVLSDHIQQFLRLIGNVQLCEKRSFFCLQHFLILTV